MEQSPLTSGDLRPLLEQYEERFSILATLLIEENKIHNLTRITDPAQIRLRHFLDSLIALKILDPRAGPAGGLSCVDIGSGAGFPVLPLAIVRPQWNFLSAEATGKKAGFQRKACEAIGLSNVQVISARAEELAHDRKYRQRFDAVLARAVADLSILAELSLGFVRPGGRLIAWKGPDIAAELAAAQWAFEQMGAPGAQAVPYALEKDHAESIALTLVAAEKKHPTPDLLPRSFGQIKKKPL